MCGLILSSFFYLCWSIYCLILQLYCSQRFSIKNPTSAKRFLQFSKSVLRVKVAQSVLLSIYHQKASVFSEMIKAPLKCFPQKTFIHSWMSIFEQSPWRRDFFCRVESPLFRNMCISLHLIFFIHLLGWKITCSVRYVEFVLGESEFSQMKSYSLRNWSLFMTSLYVVYGYLISVCSEFLSTIGNA